MRRLAGLPEFVAPCDGPAGRPYRSPCGRADGRPRLLTPVYASLRRAFSGSTWYLAEAAMAEGVLDGAFSLNPEDRFNARLAGAGASWKLGRILRRRRSGGFKFVERFHDILWSQHIDRLRDTVVINNTQIYGSVFLDRFERLGIRPCFFIDGTLADYFHGYGQFEEQTIGRDMVARAIELERRSYERAALIMTMSHAAAASVVGSYGISPDRVVVVTPGANIDDAAVPPPSAHDGWVGPEFTVGFVGLFPHRKGLDRLAAAVSLLRARRRPIRLVVIGNCPDVIAGADGVTHLGRIDKATEPARFVDALRSIDLGCQLSRAELLGIAVLEFLRLGVPVMATAVGGITDVLADGGGISLPPGIDVEELAAELDGLMSAPDRYRRLRQDAVRRSSWASWRRAARDLQRALDGLR